MSSYIVACIYFRFPIREVEKKRKNINATFAFFIFLIVSLLLLGKWKKKSFVHLLDIVVLNKDVDIQTTAIIGDIKFWRRPRLFWGI